MDHTPIRRTMATSADALGNQQDARYTSDYKGVDLTARDCIRRGDDHEMGAGAFYGSSRCCWPGYQSTAFSADDSHLSQNSEFFLTDFRFDIPIWNRKTSLDSYLRYSMKF